MNAKAPTVVILGATGNFGRRIATRLAGWHEGSLILAGRSKDAAMALEQELRALHPERTIETARIDQFSGKLATDLARLGAALVIHTAGPYQALDYRVASACIEIGAHYVDLADGREFVTGIGTLDQKARAANVLVVSGASTLPGVSGSVIEHYRSGFAQIDDIEICIAPAHQTPRGLGTVQAVLSYCGKPFEILEDGIRHITYGWQGVRVFRHPDLGARLAADCDVPDLDLLVSSVEGVRTVRFQASLEAWWEHAALFLMAGLTRVGVVNDWSRYARAFVAISDMLVRLGSRTGGMCIEIRGRGSSGEPRRVGWYLTARDNHGPEIPSTPAILITKKLVAGELGIRGAIPCLGLFTLEEFQREVCGFEITWTDRTQHD